MISSAHVAAVSYSNCEGAALIHAHRSYNTGSMWAQPATYRKKKNTSKSTRELHECDLYWPTVGWSESLCSRLFQDSWIICSLRTIRVGEITDYQPAVGTVCLQKHWEALGTVDQISSQITNTCVCLCKISEITGLVLLIIAQRVCTAKQTQHVMMQYLLRIAHFKEPCSSILEMTLGE